MYRRQQSRVNPKSSFKPPRTVLQPPKNVAVEPFRRVNGSSQINAVVQESEKRRTDPNNSQRVFAVVWRKQTMKKNKTWDGDGVVVLSRDLLSFRSEESGNYKEKVKVADVSKFKDQDVFKLGVYELEVDSEITDKVEIEKFFQSVRGVLSEQSPQTNEYQISNLSMRPVPTIQKQFKKVMPSTDSNKRQINEPLHNPSDEGAIIMSSSNATDTPVVIDPYLGKKLRSHQVDGVKFLYECVMGLRTTDGHGALLADDMGLGKTLMTIALIWTLLKQSPQGFHSPVAKKVLISCPVTLIGNWKKEFGKWLPMNRLGVLSLNSKNTILRDQQDLKNFARSKVYQVLIMGYEKLLNMKEELMDIHFDLLVCDEGHRLKNNSNKTLQALIELDVEKKVLLSGTPIQNDLMEFYNIINFINPGVLGSLNQFKRSFLNPILRARELNCCNPDLLEKGEERSKELIELTKPFILRRTAAVIANHLPVRTDLVLFCPPNSTQIELFRSVLGSRTFDNMIQNASNSSGSLALITIFKKICNSPSLVRNDDTFKRLSNNNMTGEINSGKLKVLMKLLEEIFRTDEKIVIVSNYTQTLDIIQSLLERNSYRYLRLDGSVPNRDRDSIINKFNNSPQQLSFVFLLSSKSGGVGLNLIGASRLILFDNDWNPAIDLQAMARIHREGQKKPVFIYRLVTTGCIDEKIFQRQLMKNSLSDKFLDNKTNSKDDLFEAHVMKDIFTLSTNTKCNTHDLIECHCEGTGEEFETSEEIDKQYTRSKDKGWVSALNVKEMNDNDNGRKSMIQNCLKDYRHIDPEMLRKRNDVACNDVVTESLIEHNESLISYVMVKVSKPTL